MTALAWLLVALAVVGAALAVRDAWRGAGRRVDELADPTPRPDDRRCP